MQIPNYVWCDLEGAEEHEEEAKEDVEAADDQTLTHLSAFLLPTLEKLQPYQISMLL